MSRRCWGVTRKMLYKIAFNNIKKSFRDYIIYFLTLMFAVAVFYMFNSLDGQFLLKSLREKSDIPVIMITSRDNEVDELISMNYGADDYVTKPFNTRILLAKIDAVLRRAGGSVNVLKGDTYTLNVSESTVEGEGGRCIDLTKNEMRILYYLLKNKGSIVTREELMSYIWDSDEFVDDNTLTVNVTRVREKLEQIGVADAIVTRRGQGYLVK